jgi:hypothetical protein
MPHDAIMKVLDDALLRDRLAMPGGEGPPAGGRRPEALPTLQDREIAMWRPITKAAHVMAEPSR